jgi:NAD(P)-dependent dehydrogenase (short-subunit alcohol dehydrogenase family)
MLRVTNILSGGDPSAAEMPTSSGFGRHTTETLAHAGHRVFVLMRDIAGRDRPHADVLSAKGIEVVELDVTDDASVERGLKSVPALGTRCSR